MSMSTQENKKLVMEGYQLFKSGDIRGLLDRYHDNAEWIAPEAEYLPFGGSFHGKQEIGRFFAELDASVQATRFEPRHFIAEGDKVVVTGDSSWVAKATGIAYDNPWVHVFTIHDGKVARFEGYYDTAPASRALHPVSTGAQAAATHLHH
jgi:ketosteroid isomerase-like protein